MRLLSIAILIVLSGCKGQRDKNPLVFPPSYCEIPDINNPELLQNDGKIKDDNAEVEQLRELLLRNE